ncbi:MAG: PLP-dependent aminotransferase family protein [Rhodospirillaceae bacterium]|jgi:2-aminoadipate transaminase|nr:PLP-dependent aminotransferase family protein [Rhodospirillaceae bacterium]
MSLSQADVTTERPPYAAWIRSSNNITQQFLSIGGQPDIVSLAGGLPAAELYPVEAIKQASARALDRWGATALEYGPVEGLPALRAAIAARMSREHGRRFEVENILLTTGAMQGLDLIGKVLIDPGDLIVAQFPTYLGALDAWRTRQPAYRKLTWDLDDPDLLAAMRKAKFVYCVPNYSNPTGALVPQNARGGLLSRAVEAGTWLVEDDPYLPLQLDGAAGASILAADAATRRHGTYDGPVVYLGTLSKSVAPGLRVGWIVAEPKLIQLLALAKQCSDLSSSMFSQAVALEYLESGAEAELTARTIACYRERRDALCAAAQAHLGEWFEWEVPPGGMFLWARAKSRDFDTNALYSFALQEKVAFVPSSVFDPDGALTSAMRLNFTRNAPDRLAEGVLRLRRAVQAYLAASKVRV